MGATRRTSTVPDARVIAFARAVGRLEDRGVLAALQFFAGLISLPYVIWPLSPSTRFTARILLTVAWFALAAFTAFLAPRLRPVAVDVSVYLSLVLSIASAYASVTAQAQILAGVVLVAFGGYAGEHLRPRGLVVFLTAGSLLYVGALMIDMLVDQPWVAGVVVVVFVVNSISVWVLAERLRDMGLSDPLTGLLNRRGLSERARQVRAIAARANRPTSIAVIDLDGFKPYNDTYGHAAGDALLVDLTTSWIRQLRVGDLVARIGGDEFVLVFPNDDEDQAAETLRRLQSLSAAPWSAGTAAWQADEDVFEAVDRADIAMYAEKRTRKEHEDR